MNCPEAIDIMGEAVEDHLEPALRPGFEGHLAECLPCGHYFEQLRITRKALHLLRRGNTGNPRRAELIERYREEFHHKDD